MNVRLTQIDGKLPNLALMRLGHWHRERGDAVTFTRSAYRHLDEPDYDKVYASAIFDYSKAHVERLRAEFPDAVVGGTASGSRQTVEQVIGPHNGVSYDDYPSFTASLGFTQRGCRLSCKFCVVPGKEGKPLSVATIADIWRGKDHPKHLHLLDNDFFGQPEEQWRARLAEIRDGKFKVCFNQGLNTRLMTAEAARELATVDYRDDGFTTKRLYTAWDNLKDEEVFFRGVDTLEAAGIPPTHLLAYMLVGFDKKETWERLLHRFNKMVARGIKPYPMVFGERHRTLPLGGCNLRIGHRTLMDFQRWVIRKSYTFINFQDYDANAKGKLFEMPTLFGEVAE